jgi:hypothetical protein
MRLSSPFACFSNAFRVFVNSFSYWEEAADLVALWLVISSYLVFSSAFTTLSSRSSTSFSRCSIFCYCSLFRLSWSSISFWSCVTSPSSSFSNLNYSCSFSS